MNTWARAEDWARAAGHMAPPIEWMAMEALRLAVNWGVWDEVAVRIGRRVVHQKDHVAPRRGLLSLEFDEKVAAVGQRDVAAAIKAAVLSQVPQWCLEAHAHYGARP